MNIHQLSLTYQVEQDRILVQITTHSDEALRVWLTRRMVANLLPHLTHAVTNVEIGNAQLATQDDIGKKMLMEFKKHESIAQSDFKTPFKPDAAIFPIGAEPLLVTNLNLTPVGKGELRIGFEEKLAGTVKPRGFQVTMGSPLLHSFMHLLESAIKLSEWGLVPTATPDTAAEESGDRPQASGPIRYLN